MTSFTPSSLEPTANSNLGVPGLNPTSDAEFADFLVIVAWFYTRSTAVCIWVFTISTTSPWYSRGNSLDRPIYVSKQVGDMFDAVSSSLIGTIVSPIIPVPYCNTSLTLDHVPCLPPRTL